jgi:hypothetical protein
MEREKWNMKVREKISIKENKKRVKEKENT